MITTTPDIQTLYQKAIRFAGEKHASQKMPASEANYLVHLANVAMEVMIAAEHLAEFDVKFAVQVALLHDVLEDTDLSYSELQRAFSDDIAEAVRALSKDESLPADQQIPDSLRRIKKFRKEVWAVKLSDRISNMQEPPKSWSVEKTKKYHQVAKLILKELDGGNSYLEQRLKTKIDNYKQYF